MKQGLEESVKAIQMDTPKYSANFTFVDGDTVLVQTVRVPFAGILEYFLVYATGTETNHEDVLMRFTMEGAVIHPWGSGHATLARGLPAPPEGMLLTLPLHTPVQKGTEIGVELTAAPTDGLTVILIGEPLKIERKLFKAPILSYGGQKSDET